MQLHLLRLFLLILGLSHLVQAEPPLLFGEVLRSMQERHPALKAAQLRREAAAAWARGAGAQPNPQLRLSIPYGYPSEEANALVQRIELGGQPGLRSKIANLQRDQADARVLNQQRELGKQAALAYYSLWSASETERLERKRFELAEKLQSAAARRLKLGEISENQFLRAELEKSQSQALLTSAQANRTIALNRLNVLLQRPPDQEIVLALAEGEALPKPSRDLLLAAVDLRPEVRVAELSAEIQRAEAELAGRQRVPDFELEAYRSSLARGAEQGVRVSLAFPLWDWGQTGAAVEQHLREAEAAESDALAQRQTVTQEALAAWELLHSEEKRRELLRGQVERFGRQADLARRGYEAGLLSLTEVLEAQRAYREALVEFVSAESEFQKRRWEVYWLSSGSLLAPEPEGSAR